MANVIISYDLHDVRDRDTYHRLNKALTAAGYEKEQVDTVWIKWFLTMTQDQAIEAAKGDFERALKLAGNSSFTLEVFASDDGIKMRRFGASASAWGRAQAIAAVFGVRS